MNKDIILFNAIKNIYNKKNYSFFINGNYNLNIFGIRDTTGSVNKFDDLIGLAYKKDNEPVVKLYNATTDPGLYYLNNPMRVEGTAILKEGQYKGAFKIGLHKGSYTALIQNKALPLYRDRNKDNKLDFDESTITTEMAGINIHRATSTAGNKSVQVDKWSAGCQVIAAFDDFKEFMEIVNKSSSLYGSTFTYTLFNRKDFE